MRYFYATILLICSVIAFYYSTRIFYNKNYKRISYRLFSLASLASGTWSLGYGMMFLCENESFFILYKAIGVVGIFWYLIFCQFIICYISKNISRYRTIIRIEACTGLIIFIVTLLPANYTIRYTDMGYVTFFSSAPIAVTYTLYMILCAGFFLYLALRMANKNHTNQVRAVGKSFLMVEFLIFFGMIFDTILPAIGINPNIPASSIFQFVGLAILYNTLHGYNKNNISMENMAEYIYRTLKTPVFVFDNNHQLVLANICARELLNTSDERLFSSLNVWHDIFDTDIPEGIAESQSEIIIDTVTKQDLNIRLSIDPIFNQYHDYIGYIVVTTDMTEHINNKILQESTDIKTQFLANMSHEIRTPLNAILGFNDAILQDPADKDKVNSYALSIHEAGDSLKNIINSILDISKIEMNQLEITSNEYSTVQLLDNVISMFELLAVKKGLAFESNIDPELPQVLIGDEQHLRQILINILNNAIKYTDSGSVILTVKVLKYFPETHITRIHFSIKDTGRGIRTEDRDKLFEKFQRLDTEHFKHTEGSGLGMSIVLHTLKAMGSQIEFDSVYGEGSDFYFVLDQVSLSNDSVGDFKERRREAAINNMKSIDFRASKAHILIVDDVEMNIDAACALLEFTNITIDSALSGKDAIKAIQDTHYDIIFMDHMMPEMDGIQTTENIRELAVETGDVYYANVPIIALTANAIVGMSEVFHKAGMQDFVSKPIEINTIISVLKKWLPPEYIERADSFDNIATDISEQSDNIEDEWNILIDGIDTDEALRYNTSFAGFEKNMHSFERAYEHNVDEISNYYQEGDIKNYVIKVHGLKSTSKMIGAISLSDTAKDIEAKGNAGEMTEDDFITLMQLYETCIDNIREYFSYSAVDTSNSNAILSEDQYAALLARIKTAAANFDAGEFIELEEELSTVAVSDEHKADISNLQTMISTLSFSQVTDFFTQKNS